MSSARVRLKFGEVLNQAFCAGAANVIFRHASTGVWVREVREYASTVREYGTREKFVDPTNINTLILWLTPRLGILYCKI